MGAGTQTTGYAGPGVNVLVGVGSLQTDLIQGYFTDPKMIAAAAVLVIVPAILLIVLISSSLRRKREEREFLERDLAAREREAQLQAAVEALPYSQDSAGAARSVAALFSQYFQVRVMAVYAGRRGYPRFANILDQSTSGTGSLARVRLASTIDARYAASHDRPQFVQRADFIDATAAAQREALQGSAALPGKEGSASQGGPAIQGGEAHDRGTQSSESAPTQMASSGPPATQGATTAPLDTGTAETVDTTAGGAQGADTAPPSRGAVPERPSSPIQQTPGTGSLTESASVAQPRGTAPLVGGAPQSATGGPDSRMVGLLPWRGPFGWSGLLVIESREPIDLEALSLEFQSQGRLSERLSVALELERSATAAGSAAHESSRLLEFMRAALESLSSRPPLTETLKQVAALLASDSASFWAVDADTGMMRMVAAHGLNPEGFLPVPRGKGLAGWVAGSREVLAVEDAPADPRCLFPNEARESGIGSYLGAPVFNDSQVEGVLEVHTRKAHAWGSTSVSAMKSAAAALSAINGGIPTVQQAPAAAAPAPAPDGGLKAESAYMTMSLTLESLGSKDEVIGAMVEVLGHALGASRVIAVERGEQTGYLNAGVIKHEYHAPEVPSTLGAVMPEEFGAPLFQGEDDQGPLVINDSATESPIPRDTITRLHICSELMVPLKSQDSVIALIDIQECGQPREWTRDEIEFADKLAHQASVAIAHLSALEKTSRDLEAARSEARRASDLATRARGIVDSVPEAILGLDRDGRLTFFNATGRVRYKLKNEDLGRMVGMVESLTLSDESIWEKVNSSHGIVRFEATIAPPRAAAPLAAPDRRATRARNAVSLPISIAVAPVRSEKDEITGRILVLTDLSHTKSHSKKDTGEHVAALEAKMKETEEALSEAHRVIERAAAADAATGRVAYVAGEIEKVRTDEARARRAAQQLLEINRLKSDFIVNAGRELDASLQSVLGFAELLGQGQYGQVTPEQLEAIKAIYAWARRMKNDVDWLIEYGSTRSRTLESAAGGVQE